LLRLFYLQSGKAALGADEDPDGAGPGLRQKRLEPAAPLIFPKDEPDFLRTLQDLGKFLHCGNLR
jgi:hypothetical protein